MARPRPKVPGNAISLDGADKPSSDKAGVVPPPMRVGAKGAKAKVDAESFRAKAAESMRR